MTNWRDGGGFYPPGSDTPSAPWNQVDPEPSDDNYDVAKDEIFPFLTWDEAATEADIAEASEYLHTEETAEAVDLTWGLGKPAPVLAIPKDLRDKITKQAEAWIEARAKEIMIDEADS